MVTDQQVRLLMTAMNEGKKRTTAAAKSGMCERTARKYLKNGRRPSELKRKREHRTRKDPFEEIWPEVEVFLDENEGLEAKALFEYFQGREPGRYMEGQLRTFQRRVKEWRALKGKEKEVYFSQKHKPGELCASDFTDMRKRGVTINGELYDHLMYHFVLTYSNWEWACACPSESFESVSEGLQGALWRLGGVPRRHRTDKLSAAVNKECSRDEFTARYRGLLRHYGIEGESINARRANENGDVESSHRGFKRAVEQALLLRGSRDFRSREEYREFIVKIVRQRNRNRAERFCEEEKLLRRLPEKRLEAYKEVEVSVSSGSTISVCRNVYSVDSRLIGEKVKVRVHAEKIEVWYGQRRVDEFARLRGSSRHRINYRHIIGWLVRKPGAFASYRYRDDLFPSTIFRMAYDELRRRRPACGHKEYLRILKLAARESETAVCRALERLFDSGATITFAVVEKMAKEDLGPKRLSEGHVEPANISAYDSLLCDHPGTTGGRHARK